MIPDTFDGINRRCNVCGEEWPDTGDQECPFCDSADTYVVDDGAAEHPM